MKIAVDTIRTSFRPKISLNLAKITMTASQKCKQNENNKDWMVYQITNRHNQAGN